MLFDWLTAGLICINPLVIVPPVIVGFPGAAPSTVKVKL